MSPSINLTPFNINVDQAILDDLQQRLANARWADHIADDWQRGVAPTALRGFVHKWADAYDWRSTETRLNRLNHYKLDGIHFVRAGTIGKPALLLIHGWPDSFMRFEKMIPMLENDFDIMIPSIPGFGFSDRPAEPGVGAAAVADRIAELMNALGLDRYGIHGGDWGSTITELIAVRHSEHVTRIHITDLAPWHNFRVDPSTLTSEESEYLTEVGAYRQREGAYIQMHITKPQTIGYALNDSPVGLAAWFLEKYQSWSDGGIHALGTDFILDTLTLYWVTQTAPSAARFYFETANTMAPVPPVTTPTAFARFPKDFYGIPRSFVERSFNVQRWTNMVAGGHFAAWEQPGLLAEDLRAFFL